MKVVLLADIHASFAALRPFLETYDELWIIGDVINFGPRQAQVIDWVRAYAHCVVRGNHGHAVGYSTDPRCISVYQWMARASGESRSSVLTEKQKQYLRLLPLSSDRTLSGTRFHLCHATQSDPLFGYLEQGASAWEAEVDATYADVVVVAIFMLRFSESIGKDISGIGRESALCRKQYLCAMEGIAKIGSGGNEIAKFYGVGVRLNRSDGQMTPRSTSTLGGVMSEQHQPTEVTRQPGELNQPQKRRLRITCQYIDKLLSDVEDILHAATSQSPFPRYIVDINPAQVRVIEDHVRRLRSQLVRTIAWQQMKPERPDIPATRAVLTNLTFIDTSIEELKPSYMKGYGPVPDDAVTELNGVVYELRSLVSGMHRYLKQELTVDLEKRLRRLEESGSDVALLRFLEQIVTRDGLVEFRSRIDMLASRLEDDSLEIALFGRVSSGKSSLLNALLGAEVLPVGINPITAVPTKLRYGNALRAGVSYGDGRTAVVTIEELSNLVSEQGNPGNLQNLVQAVVEIPSPRLKKGILLVDTPGLGSLAKRGAAETLAYLPSCDLALLLIDAGATLNEEDIGTLRLLYEAGIPALVLLSKADLLAEADRHRAVSYIQQHIKRDLGLDIAVHAVSALSQYSVTLDDFYERGLLPRFEQARSLKQASVSRKIGALREAALSAIESILDRETRKDSTHGIASGDLEGTLRVITGEVGQQGSTFNRTFREIGERPDSVIDLVSDRAVQWARTGNGSNIPSSLLADWIHDVVWKIVQQPIERLRSIGMHAIDGLQRTAKELGKTETPSPDDFEMLLRNMPRFELALLPAEINVSRWKFFREGILRSHVKASLQESIGPHLKDELHLYGMALAQWSQQTVRGLEALVNSYADAYRAQIQRISGDSDAVADPIQLQADLSLLKNWGSNNSVSLTDTLA